MARLSPMMLAPVAVFAGFAALAGWALMRNDPDTLPSTMIGREAPAVGDTTLPGKVQLTDDMLRQPGVKLVNFWNQGLHQGASLSLAPGERMAAVYRYPLYLTMAGFFLLFLALLLIRTRTEIRRRRLAALLARENRA